MKKILAVVLAIVMVFSMGAIAYAEDAETPTSAAAEEEAPAVNFNIADTINNLINQIVAALQGNVLETVKGYIQQIVDAIEGLLPQSDVLGAVADLEGALGGLNLGGDLFSYVKNLINTLKQKIKDFYCHETETVVEETEAEVPVDTGSTSIGIVAFAAVSVAAAAAYVCTKKKED